MSELPASRRLLNITKAALDHCEAECERLRADSEGQRIHSANLSSEIERLRAALKEQNGAIGIMHKVRNATIEQCAKVVDNFGMDEALSYGLGGIAAAIRALKEKP